MTKVSKRHLREDRREGQRIRDAAIAETQRQLKKQQKNEREIIKHYSGDIFLAPVIERKSKEGWFVRRWHRLQWKWQDLKRWWKKR